MPSPDTSRGTSKNVLGFSWSPAPPAAPGPVPRHPRLTQRHAQCAGYRQPPESGASSASLIQTADDLARECRAHRKFDLVGLVPATHKEARTITLARFGIGASAYLVEGLRGEGYTRVWRAPLLGRKKHARGPEDLMRATREQLERDGLIHVP